ncbi:outer membrane biogenesis protein BamB [Planctomycetes bacterium Pan216]|uniref:Outer membrane biogenesis protein BamB n=1 Tax=Kolteria novifilia TaxID=2527975 RepID=A0A518BCL4_9BACT|nr:outer membrane biogenesis protein BamB [Planctomycetes bacterium Pan216]
MKRGLSLWSSACLLGLFAAPAFAEKNEGQQSFDVLSDIKSRIEKMDVKPTDWPQWGGTSIRNNVREGQNIPTTWEIGEFDRETKEWKPGSGKNVSWVSRVGSQTYGNPVVANGKVYVGTNNGAGYLERYPHTVDLGCLLCFDAKTGKFLWQHSSAKLKTGRVHDWPLQGVCCAPYAEGDKLWFVSSRGEVLCLDAEGFRDGENDGPYKDEEYTGDNEGDVIWKVDMMKDMGISQHNMCSCSVTAMGDILFVHTANGVDETHLNIPAPDAPSFIALNKNTGEVLWTDKSPGRNILHGQWSSPAVAELGGVPQALFPGGDGWLYSFHADEFENGKPKLLWKFDCNPKDSTWILGGRGTRNNLIATPVVYNGNVYIAVGQDPEHGEGIGHLWCIDPTKRGDVSPTIALDKDGKPIDHRRIQAVLPKEGDQIKPNPNSAALWHYSQADQNGDEEIDFEEEMHRTCGTVAIKDDLLFISDFSGLVHCLDAKTGKPHWTYDLLAASWGSPLIINDKVIIGDEDGDVTIFELSPEMKVVDEINMGNSVYTTPVVADDTMYISNRTHLYSIKAPEGEKK